MNSAADHDTTFVEGFQRRRHKRSDRRKNNRGIDFSGGISSEPPAQSAPNERANFCPALSPGRVNAKTSRFSNNATWAIKCAAAPKP